MKTAVIYRSKTGFSRKYAEWMAEDAEADLFENGQISSRRLAQYERIIYGAGVYAGRINGWKKIRSELAGLTDTKVVVFAVGAAPPRIDVVNQIRDRNFSDEEKKRLYFYYLRGGFDFRRLGIVDKAIMVLLKFILRRKKALTEDEKGMLAAYDHPVDFTSRENIDQIFTQSGND